MSAPLATKSPKHPNVDAHLDATWEPTRDRIVVGKDVLELLSTSMYVDPLSVYREYIQNAADSIDEAWSTKVLAARQPGRIEVKVDAAARTITIRDNGTGVPSREFAGRMSKIGASAKRGTAARGFRGVGRLAGLGYCQELIFRSRSAGEAQVSELRWDCRKLRSALRLADAGAELPDLVRELIAIRKVPAGAQPSHFFEVELRGVVRHRNDQLLNSNAVADYLAQVAPVPFSPSFRFGDKIMEALRPHVALGQIEISVNGSEQPLFRPHANRIRIGEEASDKFRDLQIHEIPGIDGDVAAVVWVLHHSYSGALPNDTLVKGLRFRTGNLQVGDNALVEDLFPEPRFNSWAVGEVHILDSRVVPNGRRDHFEQNIHFDNVLNHLGPIVRDIARRCRQSSSARKWLRDFELHKRSALEAADAMRRRGVSKTARAAHARVATKSVTAMETLASQRQLDEEMRSAFEAEIKTTKARVSKLLTGNWTEADPFAHFKPPVQAAYKHIIQLIYDCASNGAVAHKLVDKILSKLDSKAAGAKRPPGKSKNRA